MSGVEWIPKESVRLCYILGQGLFGVVQEGVIDGRKVAIKVLNTGIKQNAEAELNVMSQLSHRNILKLVGAIQEDFEYKPKLIFEYMENGSLKEFVSRNKVNDKTLLGFCTDISCGMDYLHEMQFVHMDLAGRNVLIDFQMRAKVADFGLSRFINEVDSNYYRVNKDKILPIRWIPKESIPSEDNGGIGRFTYASDIWALGVTIWEMYTGGGLPYRSVSTRNNDDSVEQEILKGNNPNTFEKPSAPHAILRIMDNIFRVDPLERPTFAQLKIWLRELKTCANHKPIRNIIACANNIQYETVHFHPIKKEMSNLINRLKVKGYVTSITIENVMQTVDRGIYANGNPYLDNAEYIGCNANISAPRMHGRMLELIAQTLLPGHKVLDIGSGSGYMTACLARLVGRKGKAIGIDHMTELADLSVKNIWKDNPRLLSSGRVKILVGDGRNGYAADGPYHIIHIGASVPVVSSHILDQLEEGGRVVAPVGPPLGAQSLQVIEKSGKVITKIPIKEYFPPLCSQPEQLNPLKSSAGYLNLFVYQYGQCM